VAEPRRSDYGQHTDDNSTTSRGAWRIAGYTMEATRSASAMSRLDPQATSHIPFSLTSSPTSHKYNRNRQSPKWQLGPVYVKHPSHSPLGLAKFLVNVFLVTGMNTGVSHVAKPPPDPLFLSIPFLPPFFSFTPVNISPSRIPSPTHQTCGR